MNRPTSVLLDSPHVVRDCLDHREANQAPLHQSVFRSGISVLDNKSRTAVRHCAFPKQKCGCLGASIKTSITCYALSPFTMIFIHKVPSCENHHQPRDRWLPIKVRGTVPSASQTFHDVVLGCSSPPKPLLSPFCSSRQRNLAAKK